MVTIDKHDPKVPPFEAPFLRLDYHIRKIIGADGDIYGQTQTSAQRKTQNLKKDAILNAQLFPKTFTESHISRGAEISSKIQKMKWFGCAPDRPVLLQRCARATQSTPFTGNHKNALYSRVNLDMRNLFSTLMKIVSPSLGHLPTGERHQMLVKYMKEILPDSSVSPKGGYYLLIKLQKSTIPLYRQ